MSSEKGDNNRPFNKAAQERQKEQEKQDENAVPKMIREDKAAPRPPPPAIGKAVDRQVFNSQWQEEVKSLQQKDPFEEIDEKKSMRQQFDQSSKHRGQERD